MISLTIHINIFAVLPSENVVWIWIQQAKQNLFVFPFPSHISTHLSEWLLLRVATVLNRLDVIGPTFSKYNDNPLVEHDKVGNVMTGEQALLQVSL